MAHSKLSKVWCTPVATTSNALSYSLPHTSHLAIWSPSVTVLCSMPRWTNPYPVGWESALAQQLSAGGIGEPALELLGRPPARTNEQQPEVGVVEHPKDVGRPRDAKAEPQCLLPVQRLHDHPLVVVEVRLDEAPERRDVGVDRCGIANDLQYRRDAHLHDAGVASVQSQLAFGVGLLDDLSIPRSLGDGGLLLVPLEQQVPERPQHAALGREHDVHRLECHPGFARDRLHRGCGVALALE